MINIEKEKPKFNLPEVHIQSSHHYVLKSLFFNAGSQHLCQKVVGSRWLGLHLEFVICSIYPSACFYQNSMLLWLVYLCSIFYIQVVSYFLFSSFFFFHKVAMITQSEYCFMKVFIVFVVVQWKMSLMFW